MKAFVISKTLPLAATAVALALGSCLISPDKDYPVASSKRPARGVGGEDSGASGLNAGGDTATAEGGMAGEGLVAGGVSGTTPTAGNAGQAGDIGRLLACLQHPIPVKSSWAAMASISVNVCTTSDDMGALCGPPSRAIDGIFTNRFSTGKEQTGDEWFQIDFGVDVALSKVTLHSPTNDYTRAYEVRSSLTEAAIAASPVVVAGLGQQGDTVIALPDVRVGRYLRLSQTGSSLSWWSLTEIDVACE